MKLPPHIQAAVYAGPQQLTVNARGKLARFETDAEFAARIARMVAEWCAELFVGLTADDQPEEMNLGIEACELSAARAELARVNDLLSTVRMERDGLSNRIVELANELTEAVGLLRDWRLEYRYPTLPGEVDRSHRTDDFLTKHGGGR